MWGCFGGWIFERFVSVELTLSFMNKDTAYEYLKKHGKVIISIRGVNYVGIVKKGENEFEIEALVDKNDYNKDRLETYKLLTKKWKRYKKRHDIISKIKNEIKKLTEKEYKNIDEYNSTHKDKNLDLIKYTDKKIDFLSDKNNKTQVSGRGLKISNRDSSEPGTLGAFMRLKGQSSTFFISNWHVLMNDNESFKARVCSSDYTEQGLQDIGKVFWARFDKEYDIAIAEITDDKLIDYVNKYYRNERTLNLNPKPVIPKIGDPVFIHGVKTQNNTEIHCVNAFVKIGKSIFKNQIITKKSISIDGDSGSILFKCNCIKEIKCRDKCLQPEGKKCVTDIAGIVFAGDRYNYTVANPLHDLFSHPIDCTVIDNELLKHRNELDFEFLNFL